MTETLAAAILANVRPEIRDEVAYALELAEASETDCTSPPVVNPHP